MNDEDPGEKTFVRVTNRDVYNEVKLVHEKMDSFMNKVKWHQRWLGGLTMVLIIVITALVERSFS